MSVIIISIPQDIFDELLRTLVSNYSYVQLSSYKIPIDYDVITLKATPLYGKKKSGSLKCTIFFFLTISQITHEHNILGIAFQFRHHISDFVNLADEQLIGHRVLISEEEGYRKEVLIILVPINWKSGTDFV